MCRGGGTLALSTAACHTAVEAALPSIAHRLAKSRKSCTQLHGSSGVLTPPPPQKKEKKKKKNLAKIVSCMGRPTCVWSRQRPHTPPTRGLPRPSRRHCQGRPATVGCPTLLIGGAVSDITGGARETTLLRPRVSSEFDCRDYVGHNHTSSDYMAITA